MKTKSSKLIATFFVAALSVGFVACGGDDDDDHRFSENNRVNNGNGDGSGSVSLCPNSNHPHAINMGVAGVWACCNVGASKPEDYGSYFAWGETSPKSNYSWDTYKWGKADDKLTKYCNDSSYGKNGFTDDKIVLDPEDDAATKNWGSSWRMPSEAQFNKLMSACNPLWTRINNVYGILFTASNGNKIFLPAAGIRYDTSSYLVGPYGYYWSSSLNTSTPYDACGLGFYSGYVGLNHECRRSFGLCVRPVRR